jgi:methylated-DNA-[protein]-cysteine S-methyltransferase
MNRIERHLNRIKQTDVSAAAAAAERRALERANAQGLVDVAYKRIDSPIGSLLIANTEVGLVMVGFAEGDPDAMLATLAERVSPRVLELPSRLDPVHRELDEYFSGRRQRFELSIDWKLVRAGFSRAILEATARIPYGSRSTYRDVAAAAGNPRASRAAGNALGANPVPVVVPCHRVLKSDGSLGGYAGGPALKERLLAIEGALLRS